MNASQIIKVHHSLWSSQPRSFNSTRAGGLRFVTQNLSKRSKNTEWIKGDPEHRKLTWIFSAIGYKGRIREYQSRGKTIIEIHTLNPEKLFYKEEK